MDSERRYTEDEVSEIIDRATEAPTERISPCSDGTGLTLPELQEIGREVGIPDAVIARAARDLDQPRPGAVGHQTFLGQTIGVGRAVDLPRTLTDDEWHRLVVDLRETFNARGKIEDVGPFRQWTNSNLQVFLEPSEDGARLRLRTLKGNARTFQGMGLAFATAGLGMGVASLLASAGDPTNALLLGTIGAGLFLWSRLSVPSWARTRARQFEEVIAKAAAAVSRSPASNEALPSGSGDGAES